MLGSDLAALSAQAEFCVQEELVQRMLLVESAVGLKLSRAVLCCPSSFPRREQKQCS